LREDVVFKHWGFKWLLCLGLLASRHAYAAQMTWAEEPSEQLGYINIIGKIEPGDGARFRNMARWLISRGDTIHQVVLCTRGGVVGEAMDIGNQIRTLGASTKGSDWIANAPQGEVQCWLKAQDGEAILKRNTLTGQGDPNADCASACFLMWASGLTREGTYIGIHRFTFDPRIYGNLSPADAKTAYESATAQFKQFLVERDVPVSIIEQTFATGSTEMHYLTRGELQLMQSVPYLEELDRARCGELHDINEYDAYGNWAGVTYDNNWRICARKILKEIELAGVKAYSGDGVASIEPSAPEVPVVNVPETAVPNVPLLVRTEPVTVPKNVPPERRTSSWDFNGSGMYMTSRGKQRRIFYDTPRENLSTLGITKDSLLFEGELDGSSFAGEIAAYAPNCPVIKYPARRSLLSNRLRFFLVGKRPARDRAGLLVQGMSP
jgi:hypothetical protein